MRTQQLKIFKKSLLLLSDILILNLSILLIGIFRDSGIEISHLAKLLFAANKFLTLPLIILFVFFGLYRTKWESSFIQIAKAVAIGVFLFLFALIASNVVKTTTGKILFGAYWISFTFLIFSSRYFITYLFDIFTGNILEKQEIVSEKSPKGMSYSKDFIKYSKTYLVFKRVMDFICASILIILFLPTMIILALIIKLSDPKGGIFFRQRRYGKDFNVFHILKFRSMIHNAEEVLQNNKELYKKYLENNFKLPENEDPRITKIGRFLRKSSLDELPQLFNVFRGEMSLVGPRPVVLKEINEYKDYGAKFLSVKPGVTGWWQVSGRSNVEYPERIYLEMYYIDNASLLFDIRILLNTIPSVLFGTGAH